MGMTYKRGEVFWVKYYVGGKPIRESADRKNQKEAERFLKDREGRSDQIERVKALSRKLNRSCPIRFRILERDTFKVPGFAISRRPGYRLQETRTDRDGPARFPTKRCEKFGSLGGRGDGDQEDQRTQNTQRLRLLQHHFGCRPSGSRPEVSRAQSGHSALNLRFQSTRKCVKFEPRPRSSVG